MEWEPGAVAFISKVSSLQSPKTHGIRSKGGQSPSVFPTKQTGRNSPESREKWSECLCWNSDLGKHPPPPGRGKATVSSWHTHLCDLQHGTPIQVKCWGVGDAQQNLDPHKK